MSMVAVVLALGLFAQGEVDVNVDVPEPRPVRLYVTATDAGGENVGDLDVTEFRILENGEARRVESARLIQQAGQESTRVVGIFLDEYHVSPGPSADRIRAALQEFVTSRLGPDDLVAVVRPLDSLLRITATRDRDALRAAIRAFEGRKGIFAPRNDFEQDFIARSPARVEAVRSQISISALSALIRHVGDLGEGRKAVLVASEGFSPNALHRGDTLPTLDGAVRRAHQTGVVVHVLDPRDPAGEPAESQKATVLPVLSERQTLLTLADATGGIVMSGVESWGSGLARVGAELSDYYLLEFAPDSNREGRFHEIDVTVTRPAVTVKAPSGYWSRSPAERMTMSAAVPAAAAPLPIRRTSGLIRPWFGVARTDEGHARVSFVWEAVPTLTSRAFSRRLPPARVILRATTAEGSVFERAVTAAEGQTQTSLAVFDVPEGRLRLEMAIEDANAVVLDTDLRDLTIQAPGGPVALGTPAVFRARTAREMRQIRDDPNAVPVASREFRGAEQLLVRVPAYAASMPTVSLALVSRAGRIMRELTAEPSPLDDARQIVVPLSGLPAGEYRLELTAAHDGLTTSQAIDIRVVP